MSYAPAVTAEPTVEKARGTSMTEYRVRGELGAIFYFVDGLMRDRHPAGYGTRVHSIEWDYGRGEYVARISHANSCE